jgi:beta-lactamase superfamily II metal-dependent hydrolase
LGFILALGVSGCVVTQSKQLEHPDAVEITFLDVGQADAILIRSPEGKTALVDAGRGGDIVPLLQRHGVDTIDIAVASHGHSDHIGGMEHVIGEFPVRYYLDNGLPHSTSTYLDLMQTLVDSEITYLRPEARSIELGGVTLRVLPPPHVNQQSQNYNSLGIIVEYGEFRAMLTGDSEVGELNYFLELGVPDVTLLKAAHHGARDAVTPGWLAATSPEVVVISCGLNNQYGHPDEWALRYYEATASEVYRTDLDGEVTVRGLEDGTYSVATARRGK